MPFSFSFRFAVPGLSNPFATQSVFTSNHGPRARPEPKPEPVDGDNSWVVPAPAYPHHHLSPTPSSSRRRRESPSPAPISRKRGWVPSTSEPSQATIMNTSTSGFLDTPSKYREFVETEDSSDEVVVDLPPAKRRKGITGQVESVLSTAVSAALIGAAVGLTVYRMWRDRGKESPGLAAIEQTPPPPYQEEWVDARIRPRPSESSPISPISPSYQSPRVQKARSTGTPARRPIAQRHRRTQTRARIPRSGRDATLNSTPPPPEFDFSNLGDDVDTEPKDEMDWIGDKLARLIEEGKRALGTEIVVKSDAQEDEVDDGSGNWVEENEGPSSHKRSRTIGTSRSNVPSPSSHKFDFSSSPSVPISRHGKGRSDGYSDSQGISSSLPVTSMHSRGGSDFSPASFSSRNWETEDDCQSASVREAMERARASYRQKRGLGLDLG
ncbi:hypothetical protein SCHPADRAFT_940521 [Schizopora paradoxa]|uniref:Uncharacterized protein n=1 Tax=Schizopora paradoxa TaxID=27342 RepID=A0A0H2RN09_9AGAM|nr:hypothetical protein SCHPADRAFT_940521 [Schizopora paradoxa]